jgi:hypothetical protein
LVSTPKLLNFHEKINREFHGIFKNKHVHQFDYITHNFQEQKKKTFKECLKKKYI